MTDRIQADYLIETALDPREAAAVMAREQSSGTFVPVPGETEELKKRAAARIERLEIVGTTTTPSLPGARTSDGRGYSIAELTLSWPVENVGPSLPNLMTMVAGGLFELSQFSGVRIKDVRLPEVFADAYPGPKFGIGGTRTLTGVDEGPLIGTIIKPSVGFGPEETAALVRTLARAGIDFIKDDELQANGPSCPFQERARAVMRAINDHADATGKKVMFAFNVTGEIDEMKRRHDLVCELGGTGIFVSINSIGLSGMIALGRHTRLPVHAHRNGWGALSRAPMLGWSYIAWQKFWRLAGVDHMHVNGIRNKFCETDDSSIASARECLKPMFASKPCLVLPVFASGQSTKQVPETWQRFGSADLLYVAGGGIMGHPDGPAAGVESLRATWRDAIKGGNRI
jgi:ribulose-bisphosphate carboxylase large chain